RPPSCSWRPPAARVAGRGCAFKTRASEAFRPALGLIVAAPAEPTDQESNAERDRGRRVRALLDGSAQEVASLPAATPVGFRRFGRGDPCLAVAVLERALELP